MQLKSLLFAVLFSCSAFASTTVTGTIVDANGNPYANGTVSAYSVVNNGQQATYYSPVGTSSTGLFTIVIAQAGNYIFTTCAPPTAIGPLGNVTPKQVCFTSGVIAVSGGSMDISAALNALAPLLGPKQGGSGGSGNVLTGNQYQGAYFPNSGANAIVGPDPNVTSNATNWISTHPSGLRGTSFTGTGSSTGIWSMGVWNGGVEVGTFSLTASPTFSGTGGGYAWYVPNSDAPGFLYSPGGGTPGSPSQLQILAGSNLIFPATVSGTTFSGGVTYFSNPTTLSSSGILTQYGVLFGGGAGAPPTASAQGGANFPLIGQGAANPIFSTIAYPSSLTGGGLLYASNGTTLTGSAALTGFVRGGNPPTAGEFSGDCFTSAGFSITCTKLNGVTFSGTVGDVVTFGAGGNTPGDSNFLATNVPRINIANNYAAGKTQQVTSNSTAAGSQDVGTSTDPPCYAALVGTSWFNTDKILWNDCTSRVDNAGTPNYLVAGSRSSLDDDQENLWNFQFLPARLASIENGNSVYLPILFGGDSDTAGTGAFQLSFVYPFVTQAQNNWQSAGPGWVSPDSVKNPMPSSVTTASSGAWTACSCGDGSCSNTHPSAPNTCLGLDNTDVTIASSGAYQQYTGVFTKVYSYWAVQSGGGTVENLIDGSPDGTGNTSGSSYGVLSVASSTLTEGTHILRAQTTSAGTNTFLGALLLDTSTGHGVVVLKAGAAANTISNFVGNPIYQSLVQQIDTDLNTTLSTGIVWFHQMWGANEFNQNIAPATMLSGMTTLASAVSAAATGASVAQPDISMGSDPDYGAPTFPLGANTQCVGAGGAQACSMLQYDKAINDLANKNHQPFISFTRHTWPESLNTNALRGIYAADNVHLSPVGQQIMASLVLDRISPSGRFNPNVLGGSSFVVNSIAGTTYTATGQGGTYGTGDFGCTSHPGKQIKAANIGGLTVTLPATGFTPPSVCGVLLYNANSGTLTFNAGAGMTLIPAAGNTLAQYEQAFVWYEGGTNYRWVAWKIGGSGTLTNVATTAPVAGGPITTTGTISLQNGSAANITSAIGSGTALISATGSFTSLHLVYVDAGTGSLADSGVALSSFVQKTGTQTITGIIDISGGTLKLPIAAGLTTSTTGNIGIDSTNNNPHIGVNSTDTIIPVVPTATTVTDGHGVIWSVSGGKEQLADLGTAPSYTTDQFSVSSGTMTAATNYYVFGTVNTFSSTSINGNAELFCTKIYGLTVNTTTNVGAGNTIAYTVYDGTGSSATTSTCSIAAGASTCTDTSHTPSWTAGHGMEIQATCTGTCGISQPAANMRVYCR